jgi:hypothetical protein
MEEIIHDNSFSFFRSIDVIQYFTETLQEQPSVQADKKRERKKKKFFFHFFRASKFFMANIKNLLNFDDKT